MLNYFILVKISLNKNVIHIMVMVDFKVSERKKIKLYLPNFFFHNKNDNLNILIKERDYHFC